jgi:hypothetical protein
LLTFSISILTKKDLLHCEASPTCHKLNFPSPSAIPNLFPCCEKRQRVTVKSELCKHESKHEEISSHFYPLQKCLEVEACRPPVDVPTPTSGPNHPDRPSDTVALADANSCALCCRFYASEPASDNYRAREEKRGKILFLARNQNRFNLIKFNEVKRKIK